MNAGSPELPPEDKRPKKGGLLPPSTLGDEEGVVVQPDEPAAEQQGTRDRISEAREMPLTPVTLVGSWFIRLDNGEMTWWGLVIAEPSQGYYLCDVSSGLEGAVKSGGQVVVELETMRARDEGYEWRFYDNEDAMKAAFFEYGATQKEDE